MAHEDLAYKTLTGQTIHHTRSFALALDLQDDTGIELKDAKFIVHVADYLSEYYRTTFSYSELKAWAQLNHGKPFPFILDSYNKVKAEVARKRAEEARRREAAANIAFMNDLHKAFRSLCRDIPSLSKQFNDARRKL